MWGPSKIEDRHFPGGPSTPLAFARTTEIALVNLDFAIKKRRFLGQLVSNYLAQLVEKQDRRVAVHTR